MPKRLTAWYRKLLDLAELAGDENQKQIATRCHVSEGAVSGWVEGKEPRIDAVRKVALGYTEFVPQEVDELFRELLLRAYPAPKNGGPHQKVDPMNKRTDVPPL